jgi:hypothetical protein
VSNFKIDFVSRQDYESLVVEISYQGQRLCEIDRELGVDNMRIFFVDDVFVLPQPVKMMFSLSDFASILEKARVLLAEVSSDES